MNNLQISEDRRIVQAKKASGIYNLIKLAHTNAERLDLTTCNLILTSLKGDKSLALLVLDAAQAGKAGDWFFIGDTSFLRMLAREPGLLDELLIQTDFAKRYYDLMNEAFENYSSEEFQKFFTDEIQAVKNILENEGILDTSMIDRILDSLKYPLAVES